MSLKLSRISRFIRDQDGRVARPPVQDMFLEDFEDEIIRLLLYMLANRQWTGNRFESQLIGTPLFMRRVKNKAANGWSEAGSWGAGTEIGRTDKSWKILVCGFDCNQVSAERAQGILDKGWRNITSQDDYDLVSSTCAMGYQRGLSAVPPATVIQGDREVFKQDMMMMRLYSTDQ